MSLRKIYVSKEQSVRDASSSIMFIYLIFMQEFRHKEINMTSAILRDKVIREINLIPQEKLSEVYNFIHYFRIGTEKEKVKTTTSSLLSYAGTWKNMRDEVFDDFLSDIGNRRKRAFVGRRENEASID